MLIPEEFRPIVEEIMKRGKTLVGGWTFYRFREPSDLSELVRQNMARIDPMSPPIVDLLVTLLNND